MVDTDRPICSSERQDATDRERLVPDRGEDAVSIADAASPATTDADGSEPAALTLASSDEVPVTHQEPVETTHEFYASAAHGLEGLLSDEIRGLEVRELRPLSTGVTFFGTLAVGYRVLLWSRLASRVSLILSYVDAIDEAQLYRSIRALPWEDHLDVHGTLAVDARGTNPNLRNTQFTALRTKDAVCDRFRDLYGERPNVAKHPDLRISISVHGSRATVAIDLAGESLHHRGHGGAAMKGGSSARESLAAAALVCAGWKGIARKGGMLIDPMCGSGALAIEAAMVACDMAPGILRTSWGFNGWKGHDQKAWDALLDEADERAEAGRAHAPVIIAIDPNPSAVETAQSSARLMGLEDVVDVRQGSLIDFATIELPEPGIDAETGAPIPGLVATIPPAGARSLSAAQRPALWAVLGQCVRSRFEGWRFALVTPDPTVDAPLGLRATSSKALPDGKDDTSVRLYTVADDPTMRLVLDEGATVFASEPGTGQFVDRLRKMHAHRAKWARHTGVGCYRIYDADLPDYNFAIDMYEGAGLDEGKRWVNVSEYAAPSEVDPAQAAARLSDALTVIPPVLGVEPKDVFLKVRHRAKGGSQYASDQAKAGICGITSEDGLLFEVNLSDYLDTGIFLDHRLTRGMVGSLAEGKRFLNLFAYTGVATVHAAKGGAMSTTTVDLSGTYLGWARRNMELNGFDTYDEGSSHEFIQSDVMEWVASQRRTRNRWDVIFVDPPTFSNSSDAADWDIERDHVELLVGVSRLATRSGTIIFSCNKRGFKPDLSALRRAGVELEEITRRTIPEDFERNPKIHCCYEVRRFITDDEREHYFGDASAAAHAERARTERKTVREGRRPSGSGRSFGGEGGGRNDRVVARDGARGAGRDGARDDGRKARLPASRGSDRRSGGGLGYGSTDGADRGHGFGDGLRRGAVERGGARRTAPATSSSAQTDDGKYRGRLEGLFTAKRDRGHEGFKGRPGTEGRPRPTGASSRGSRPGRTAEPERVEGRGFDDQRVDPASEPTRPHDGTRDSSSGGRGGQRPGSRDGAMRGGYRGGASRDGGDRGRGGSHGTDHPDSRGTASRGGSHDTAPRGTSAPSRGGQGGHGAQGGYRGTGGGHDGRNRGSGRGTGGDHGPSSFDGPRP